MAWNKVRLNGEDSDGCLYTVIAGLNTLDDAEATFLEFCKLHLRSDGFDQKLYSHYVFAGPSRSGGNTGRRYAYAPEFAKFLTKNALGTVTASPEADNPKFHKGRLGQVFIWTPDQKACSEWLKAWEKTHGKLKDKMESTYGD